MAKHKLPKKVMGVKIPKALRSFRLLKGLVGSATGRQIVADALIAGAAAAAGALVGARSETVQKAGNTVIDTADESGAIVRKAVSSATGALTDVLGNAAKAAVGDQDPKVERRRREQTSPERAH
jgi:hypothetical protein